MMLYEPVRITVGREAVTIEWDDGVSTTISGPRLRAACPCAECREHRAAAASPIQLADRTAITDGSLVGGYALRFAFADGHGDGIYPYGQLRHLGDP
jgi:DUF971 family protein